LSLGYKVQTYPLGLVLEFLLFPTKKEDKIWLEAFEIMNTHAF
jgi:hypothetical protein